MEISQRNLFPTNVFTGNLNLAERQNMDLLHAIFRERDEDETGLELSNFRSLGGWHSRSTLHKESEFALIANAVRNAAAVIADKLSYDSRFRLDIHSMWAIVNSPGASNRSHIHPGSLWSGVYYVKAPENSGQIEFLDPRTANLMNQPQYLNRPKSCYASVTYDPEPGLILLFPSWLYHTVHPNLSDDDRVIVSFNLS